MKRTEYLDYYKIVGAAMEVHRQLGRGLDEHIYQEALQIELEMRGITVEREKKLSLWYKYKLMKKYYYVDMYYNGLIIELKSVSNICSEHRAQLQNYMRISKTYRGLLINFGEKSLYAERYLYCPKDDNFKLINSGNYKRYIDKE